MYGFISVFSFLVSFGHFWLCFRECVGYLQFISVIVSVKRMCFSCKRARFHHCRLLSVSFPRARLFCYIVRTIATIFGFIYIFVVHVCIAFFPAA